jgi:hypothetical protein
MFNIGNNKRRICQMKEMKKQRRFPQERNPKKRDPGLVSFLTTYHKTMWTAKYKCTFVYEDDDDDTEIAKL